MSISEEEFAQMALVRMRAIANGEEVEDLPDVDDVVIAPNPALVARPVSVCVQPQRRVKKTEGREEMPPGMRFDVLSRDEFTCQACGSRPGNENLHVDHLLPWSRGGAHHLNNLTALCRGCNLGKGARIWIPSRLLLTSFDDDGFAVWKRFGSWNIEVAHNGDGMIANWDRSRGRRQGYTWFDIDRCWEGHGHQSWDGWIDHFGRKALHIGCDDDCQDITVDDVQTCGLPPGRSFRMHCMSDPLPWIAPWEEGDLGALARHNKSGREHSHSMSDLATTIEFMRTIYRRDHR